MRVAADREEQPPAAHDEDEEAKGEDLPQQNNVITKEKLPEQAGNNRLPLKA